MKPNPQSYLTATGGMSYTTRGAVPPRMLLLALPALKDRTTAPANNPPITCTTSTCNPSTNTLWLGLVSSGHLARDRYYLPAGSFKQWHKRTRTVLQEHSLPSVLLHFTRTLCFHLGFFVKYTIFLLEGPKKTSPELPILKASHEFYQSGSAAQLLDTPPPLLSLQSPAAGSKWNAGG